MKSGGSLDSPLEENIRNLDTLVCMLYPARRGKTTYCTENERQRPVHFKLEQLEQNAADGKKLAVLRRSFFVSQHAVGSNEWRADARNFVADQTVCVNELFSHVLHLKLQARRASFIAERYWGRAVEKDLSRAVEGGKTPTCGDDLEGSVLLERLEDISLISRNIKDVIKSCFCKIACSSKRCFCFRSARKCVGCKCDADVCTNQIALDIGNNFEEPLTSTATENAEASVLSSALRTYELNQDAHLDHLHSESESADSLSDVNKDEKENDIDELL